MKAARTRLISGGEESGPVQPGEGKAPCRRVGRVCFARARVKTLASATPCFPFPFLPRRCSLAGEEQAGLAAAELRCCCCCGSGSVGARVSPTYPAPLWDLWGSWVREEGGRGRPTPTGLEDSGRQASSGSPCSLGRQSGHQVGSSLLAPLVMGHRRCRWVD